MNLTATAKIPRTYLDAFTFRGRKRPAGFIVPCATTLSDKAPRGPLLHKIKRDGNGLPATRS